MSYVRTIEYEIMPEESFPVTRNCSGCGSKSIYMNTDCFRVNANGSKIDVWLIYQCMKCRHTKNLTIYERCRPESIPKQEYKDFLSNAPGLAFQYGTDSQLFARNRVEIDWENVNYKITESIKPESGTDHPFREGDLLVVHNRHLLKVRADKVVSKLLGLSRSAVRELEKAGKIAVTELKQEHVIRIEIKQD